VRDVVARADGSVVALGVIGGEAVFGAGEENETVVDCGALASCDDVQRAFIAAFAADGDLEWVRTSGFCTGDLVSDLGPELRVGELALSRDGGIAAAGAYQGACAFGASEAEEIALASTDGTYDPFAAAFSADGAPRWAAAGAGTCDDGAEAAAFSVDGSLIVAGIYSADWQFVDSGFPCSSSIAFGAGEPNETVLPDHEDGNGASGFVAVFADH
jgi:hypothetical protein